MTPLRKMGLLAVLAGLAGVATSTASAIRNKTIIETQAESLLQAIKCGTVSTNVHLRKLHNFCLAMNWLPWPLIPRRLWPEIQFLVASTRNVTPTLATERGPADTRTV